MPNILPENFDFTAKDFDGMIARLVELSQSVRPDIDVESVTSIPRLFLELFAHVSDVLTFYADQAARNSRLWTTNQRAIAIHILRMLNYTMSGAEAATVDVTFSIPSAALADVTIPQGTTVRTRGEDPVRFILLSAVTITQGSTSITGSVQAAEEVSATFEADGRDDFEIFLSRSPFLDDSEQVSADNGAYTRVSSFFGSGATDRHYVVLVDERDRARLVFGGGGAGEPPQGTVNVTHKIGGGIEGNVEANTIRVVEGLFQDAEGRTVQLSVNNASKAGGGEERESIEEARIAAPESIRALTRSITKDDFEIHARQVSGVGRALMLTSDNDSAVEENRGILLIVPNGGGIPSQALKDAVLEQVTVTYPAPLTFLVSVQDPVYVTIDIEARVHLASGATKATVRDQLRDDLTAALAESLTDGTPNPTVDFGAEGDGLIAWSDLFDIARDNPGVRRIDPGNFKLNGNSGNVSLATREFPEIGDITIIDAETGSPV